MKKETWLIKYLKMSQHEKEYYNEFEMSDAQKSFLIDLERLINALEILANDYTEQLKLFPTTICIPEEIALLFDDEGKIAANSLHHAQLISESQYEIIMQIDSHFKQMSKKNNDYWTLNALKESDKWAACRKLAKKFLQDFGSHRIAN